MAAIFDMPCFPFCFMYIVRVSSSTLTALSGGLNENSDSAGQVTDTRVFLPMDVTKPTIIADGYQRKVTSEHFTAAISAFGTSPFGQWAALISYGSLSCLCIVGALHLD